MYLKALPLLALLHISLVAANTFSFNEPVRTKRQLSHQSQSYFLPLPYQNDNSYYQNYQQKSTTYENDYDSPDSYDINPSLYYYDDYAYADSRTSALGKKLYHGLIPEGSRGFKLGSGQGTGN